MVSVELRRYMKAARQTPKTAIPNNETISAIKEVQRLKKDPNKKVYDSFADFMKEMAESVS